MHNSLSEILRIIVGEAFNGCTDARSTVEHFEKLNRYSPETRFDLKEVKLISNMLNFAAIRENNNALYSYLRV